MNDPSIKPDADPLSHLRHELRTPLNQIIGYSEMLEEEAEQSELPQFVSDLQKIQRAAHTLLDAINTALTPGAVSAGLLMGAPPLAESRPAAGEAPASEPVAQAHVAPLAGQVLVVDDDELNRDMLAQRLQRHGCTVTTAADGVAALALIGAQAFDLVLLDVMMPELDGEAVLRRLKGDASTRDLPVIMVSALDDIARVARCIQIGAEDYLPKPFDPTILRARVGACLEKKALRDQERKTHAALIASQRALARELADAADYVEALLPTPLAGGVSTEWRFIPSTSLGGDAFGYHWIDPDHFALYLLDVCGHGVGTTLMSISAINVLRAQSLPGADFRDPGQVLGALGNAFLMEKHNDLYFTMWYGVYQVSTRRLAYGSAGHPPAILVSPEPTGASTVVKLGVGQMPIGMLGGAKYSTTYATVPPGSRLFVFSDGAYELELAEGGMWPFDDFVGHLAHPPSEGQSDLDRLVNLARNLHGRPDFEDDFSIVRVAFS